MSDQSHYLKRLAVALEVNDRTNRLRDDAIRLGHQNHVTVDELAKSANLSLSEIDSIIADTTPPLLPDTKR